MDVDSLPATYFLFIYRPETIYWSTHKLHTLMYDWMGRKSVENVLSTPTLTELSTAQERQQLTTETSGSLQLPVRVSRLQTKNIKCYTLVPTLHQ